MRNVIVAVASLCAVFVLACVAATIVLLPFYLLER